MAPDPPSLLPSYALDQALAGFTAGIISTLCMQPLDLLKVQLQVSTSSHQHPRGALGSIAEGFRGIVRNQGGWKGLYRGIGPNLAGNASSWGLYFLWYTDFKKRLVRGDDKKKLNAGQHLLASASSGIVTAILTNPLWVVKTRMYTTSSSSPHAYTGVLNGLYRLFREEGLKGGSKGMTLALIGVSNGAVQFMTYEELKKWRIESKRRKRIGTNGSGQGKGETDLTKLSNLEYILMSGSAKLVAISLTYPYQVIRSRIQYQPQVSSSLLPSAPSPSPSTIRNPRTIEPYTSIPNVITRTYAQEGLGGFYKGIGTNAIRILPGTCVTFVVYEQVGRWLEKMGERKQQARSRGEMGEEGG
ncbi:uncharacterized protein JCM6883_007378 [Sporobolomyces salmoneus]|uniref:uncharacterized protein n=1 Tax=Sporobolomyces salmoneus TaxID=183962 RepID=UPI003173A4F9